MQLPCAWPPADGAQAPGGGAGPRRAAGGVACAGRTAPYRHSKTPPLPARAALGCAAGAAALERAILGGCVAAATAFPAGASRGAACCSVLV